MPGIIFDVEADTNRDFNMNLVWFDQYGNERDIGGWGALCEVRELESGNLVGRVTDGDTIVLHNTPEKKGEIDLNIPAAKMNPGTIECEYELIAFPNSSDPTDRPEVVVRGLMTFRSEIATL